MGLEIEFDGRLLADTLFADRVDPYLAALVRYPELSRRPIAIYEGGGALLALSRSNRAADAELYRRLVEALSR
jgi:hypothetical protein